MNTDKQHKWITAEDAIGFIRSGNRISIPIACGLPLSLMEAMVLESSRLRDVEIIGGLQIQYPFLKEGLENSFRFKTWQCSPSICRFLKKGTVEYIPMRQGDVMRVFSRGGPCPVDIAMIQISPPDAEGFCSLGVSIEHTLPMVFEADLVIAEVNTQMPRVMGNAFVHLSKIDYLVESNRPLIEYPSNGDIGESEDSIGRYIADMIPNGATIQIGIGTIPQMVLRHCVKKKDLRFFAIGVDGMVDVVEAGAVERNGEPKIFIMLALGTEKLFRFIHNNPMVAGRTLEQISNPIEIARIPKFHSIISAIEVDLTGQLNAETINGRQFSAIGGSIDYVEGAIISEGGKSIVGMTSTTTDGKVSRIVPCLPSGSAVTTPRHSIQYVVTEFGVANLWGKTLKERAKALIAIAHPKFRDSLLKVARKKFFI